VTVGLATYSKLNKRFVAFLVLQHSNKLPSKDILVHRIRVMNETNGLHYMEDVSTQLLM
jgi:hypothetical protein